MKKTTALFLLACALGLQSEPALSVCGDIFPPGSPGKMDCGDGVVNVLDAVVAGDRIKNALGASAIDTPATGFAEVELNRPWVDDVAY